MPAVDIEFFRLNPDLGAVDYRWVIPDIVCNPRLLVRSEISKFMLLERGSGLVVAIGPCVCGSSYDHDDLVKSCQNTGELGGGLFLAEVGSITFSGMSTAYGKYDDRLKNPETDSFLWEFFGRPVNCR